MKSKNKLLQVRIEKSTNDQLHELRKHFKLADKSDVVRFLIVKSYRRNILNKRKVENATN